MTTEGIRNIIFDLGGVIIDIDTRLAFQELSSYYQGNKSAEGLFSENAGLFLDFEKGLITAAEFREGIRKLTENAELSDQQIDDAWNRMLLKIPEERFAVLEKIRPHYQLYVLSNTNAIHVPAFNQIVKQTSGKEGIGHYFDKVYFSHEMQKRKPDSEIYQQLLEECLLKPAETIFIDDRRENIDAAASLGMRVFHVTPEQGIVDFFDEA